MRLTEFLDRMYMRADIRTAAGSLAIVGLVLIVFGRVASPWLESRMGGQPVLDVMFRRSPDDIDAALEAYGAAGRRWYRRYLAVDVLFPLLYSPLLAISVAFAARQLHVSGRYARGAMMIPFIGGVFDWGENLLLWVQTGRFPEESGRLGWAAGAFTVAKSAAFLIAGIVSFIGLVVAGVRAVLKRL